MSPENIREVILEVVREKDVLASISEEQDFFDRGASSLTVVDMQLQIEEAIGRTVPTSTLMLQPTINGWIIAYSDAPAAAAAAQ